jgi:uncharacterized protein YybS (DUF2232 family)
MNNKIKNTLIAISVIIFLTLLNFSIPFFSLFVMVVWPIPVVIIAVQYNTNQAGLVIAVAAIVNGLLFSPIMGLMTVIGFGLIGFVLGGSINEGLSPFKTLLFTILAVLLSQTLIFGVTTYIIGYDFNNIINNALDMLLQTPQIDKTLLTQFKAIIQILFPAMIIISSTVMGTLNYYASIWFLKKRGYEKAVFTPIQYWKFPRWIVSLGILFTLLYNTHPFLVNLNVILFFLAFLQGFAVGLFYIVKKDSFFLNMVYVGLVFIIPFLAFGLIFVGLIDMWFNLRKLNKK